MSVSMLITRSEIVRSFNVKFWKLRQVVEQTRSRIWLWVGEFTCWVRLLNIEISEGWLKGEM